MSGFLLDTNIPSETMRPAPEPRVLSWLDSAISREAQFVSVLTIGELRNGAALMDPGARRTQLENFILISVPSWFGPRILPVTQVIAERWGTLNASRRLAGRPMSVADGLIAATAIEHGLTLVTRNEKDFAGLGVAIFNPWLSD